MRYLLVLAALGEHLGRRLVEQGVSGFDAELWLLAWDATLADLAQAKPGSHLGYAYSFESHLRTHRQLLLAQAGKDDDE